MIHPRLVLSDLDGTLLDRQHRVTPRAQAALARAAACGATVVLATGRNVELVIGMLDGLESVHYVIATNGAAIHDVSSGALLWQATFDMRVARGVIAELRDRDLGFRFALFTDVAQGHEIGFGDRLPVPPLTPEVHDISVVDGTRVQRLAVFHPEVHASAYIEDIRRLLPDGLAAPESGLDLVEIMPSGVDKASAASKVAESVGISPHDAIAFGDNANDWSMLRWAGISFAMGNADDRTKAVADIVIGHHDEDGVAIELERIFA